MKEKLNKNNVNDRLSNNHCHTTKNSYFHSHLTTKQQISLNFLLKLCLVILTKSRISHYPDYRFPGIQIFDKISNFLTRIALGFNPLQYVVFKP